MNKPSNQVRIRNIYQMLFELATGNLEFRLQSNSRNDEIDQLINLLNQLAKKMQVTFLNHGYVSPHYSYQNLVQFTIILDKQNMVTSYTLDTLNILGHKSLLGEPFISILAEQSVPLWEVVTKEFTKDKQYFNTLPLLFITQGKTLVSSFCTVSWLVHSDKLIINSITTILQELVYELTQYRKINSEKPRPSEAETMQQLYDYILDNLEKPLPTIKQLSRLFKVNEFDLKKGFRTFFHTSIHHFYNEERLKRAHLMITETDFALKVIAMANGYDNYTSFYKAFKQRFGYAPGALQRGCPEK